MIKVKIEKLKKYGENGVSLQLPPIFQQDHSLNPGDEIELYRGQIDGRDAIVILSNALSLSKGQKSKIKKV
jgi:transcription elongation factor